MFRWRSHAGRDLSTGVDDPDPTTLSPEEAFAALGNETRMDILQALDTAG